LLVADLHLGKSGHFRKAGIAVSSKVDEEDLARLETIIAAFPVERVYLLGDLFHSKLNNEWQRFTDWRKRYASIEFHLVKGNHDILDEERILEGMIAIHREDLFDDPFIFSHQQPVKHSGKGYSLSGHIHPSVLLHGKGLGSITLPCFWFAESQGVLPAFGGFTGHHPIEPQNGDLIFAIYENSVNRIEKKPLKR
jgi:DNA ligase-associated metallophosphoesterase